MLRQIHKWLYRYLLEDLHAKITSAVLKGRRRLTQRFDSTSSQKKKQTQANKCLLKLQLQNHYEDICLTDGLRSHLEGITTVSLFLNAEHGQFSYWQTSPALLAEIFQLTTKRSILHTLMFTSAHNPTYCLQGRSSGSGRMAQRVRFCCSEIFV